MGDWPFALLSNAILNPLTDQSAWFRAAAGPRFLYADHAIDTAVAVGGGIGEGIALAAGHLRIESLVAPFDIAASTEVTYRITRPIGSELRPDTYAFRDWNRSETADCGRFSESGRIVSAASKA